MAHVLLDKCNVDLEILNTACLIHPPFNLNEDMTLYFCRATVLGFNYFTDVLRYSL